MKTRTFLGILALLATTLACYTPIVTVSFPTATEPPGSTGGGEPLITPTSVPPENTSIPTLTPTFTLVPTFTLAPTFTLVPTITLTPTPSTPTVQAGAQDVNCRYGPATTYLPTGSLLKGYTAAILGKSDDGKWWYIQDPRQPGIYCFVAMSVTTASGNLASVLTIATPATRVINVTVQTLVPSTLVSCVGGFPISIDFTATVATNGPAIVTWRWELSQGNISANDTLTFTAFGAQSISDNHHAGAAGDYWVRLHVLAPNDTYGQANYHVSCTP